MPLSRPLVTGTPGARRPPRPPSAGVPPVSRYEPNRYEPKESRHHAKLHSPASQSARGRRRARRDRRRTRRQRRRRNRPGGRPGRPGVGHHARRLQEAHPGGKRPLHRVPAGDRHPDRREQQGAEVHRRGGLGDGRLRPSPPGAPPGTAHHGAQVALLHGGRRHRAQLPAPAPRQHRLRREHRPVHLRGHPGRVLHRPGPEPDHPGPEAGHRRQPGHPLHGLALVAPGLDEDQQLAQRRESAHRALPGLRRLPGQGDQGVRAGGHHAHRSHRAERAGVRDQLPVDEHDLGPAGGLPAGPGPDAHRREPADQHPGLRPQLGPPELPARRLRPDGRYPADHRRRVPLLRRGARRAEADRRRREAGLLHGVLRHRQCEPGDDVRRHAQVARREPRRAEHAQRRRDGDQLESRPRPERRSPPGALHQPLQRHRGDRRWSGHP